MTDYAAVAGDALRDWAQRRLARPDRRTSDDEREMMQASRWMSRGFLRALEGIPEDRRGNARSSGKLNARAFAVAVTFHLPPVHGVAGTAGALLTHAGYAFDQAFIRSVIGFRGEELPSQQDRRSLRVKGVHLTHAAIHVLAGALEACPDDLGNELSGWQDEPASAGAEPRGMPAVWRANMIKELRALREPARKSAELLQGALAASPATARKLRSGAREEQMTTAVAWRRLLDNIHSGDEQTLAGECVKTLLVLAGRNRADGMNLADEHATALVADCAIDAATEIIAAIDRVATEEREQAATTAVAMGATG